MVRCKQCKGMFPTSNDFVQHDCPMVPEPLDGESWEAYKARADAFAKEALG